MVKLKHILFVNNKVNVKFYHSGENIECTVEAIDDNYLKLSFFSKSYVDIHKFNKIEITFEKEDAIYSFETEIESLSLGPKTIFTCKIPEEINKRNLRKFKRLKIKAIINYFFFNFDNSENNKIYSGILNDISQGGLSILAREKPLNNYVCFKIKLPNNVELDTIDGKIVRIVNTQMGFLISLKFINISENDVKKIVEFINDNEG